MRRAALIAAVVLQVAVLAAMALPREWVLHRGRTVWVRTVPVDPRDVMRGDYVHLNFPFSQVPRAMWRDGLKDQKLLKRDQQVFLVLRPANGDLYEADYLTDRRPAAGVYLRGRVNDRWGGDVANVRYGLEAYFVQQGTGLDLERARAPDGTRLLLEMQVAIGGHGLAVLKGHRYAPLSIAISVPRRNNRADFVGPQEPLIATVTLRNSSERPLAIVDRAGGRSFSLQCGDAWRGTDVRWVGEGQPLPAPQPGEVHLLAPGEAHHFTINLEQPEWFVEQPNRSTPSPLSDVATWAPFRLVYHGPTAAEAAQLPHAEALWLGELPSPGFTVQGMID
jgi:uncharacterized membrane-anchored protein